MSFIINKFKNTQAKQELYYDDFTFLSDEKAKELYVRLDNNSRLLKSMFNDLKHLSLPTQNYYSEPLPQLENPEDKIINGMTVTTNSVKIVMKSSYKTFAIRSYNAGNEMVELNSIIHSGFFRSVKKDMFTNMELVQQNLIKLFNFSTLPRVNLGKLCYDYSNAVFAIDMSTYIEQNELVQFNYSLFVN